MLLTTQVSGASPLTEASRLDLRPFLHSLDAIPVELTDAAAAALGKPNPVHLGRVDRFFYGRLGQLPFVGTVAVSGLGGVQAYGGSHDVGLPLLAAGVVGMTATGWKRTKARRCASMPELRAQAFAIVNPGATMAEQDRADARALQRIADLPVGDRDIWISDQLRIHGGAAADVDLELGTYCYEDRSTDSKGDTSYSTQTISYLFVPLPRDIQARGGAPFRVGPKGFFRRRGDVSLSAAFDREYVIDTVKSDPNADLFITRVLAPDVQELILRYGAHQRVDLTFTGHGVLVRSQELGTVLGKDGHHHSVEGAVLVHALFRHLHVVHEVFEQIEPAYKLDRQTKAAVLTAAGLDATR